MNIPSPLGYFRDRKIRLLLLVADLVAISVAYYAAYFLRFEGAIGVYNMAEFYRTVPLLAATGLFYLMVFEVYRGMWRYASINDLYQIIKAITATSLTFVIILYLIRHETVPRSVIVIQWLISLVAIGGLRFAARLVRKVISTTHRQNAVLVFGAGDAGEMIIRQMLNNPHYGYDPVGIIDDNPKKRNLRLHGVKVLGGRERIPTIAQRRGVREIIIAAPSITGEQMRELVNECKAANIGYRTLPGPRELVHGDISLTQLREVQLEDLLGREPIVIETGEITRTLSDRRVLVTGAGGSIGSELCRQILSYRPSQLICLERAENPLYFLEQELRRTPTAKEYPDIVVPLICDVGNRAKLDEMLRLYKPHTVFHAAAHKHVPLMELHPEEAVMNNVFGTMNVMELSSKHGAEELVLISTDKAVAPSCVMGASKRIAELLMQGYASTTGMRCVTVRFGNVIGSDGSIVPLWQKQIAQGGPVTVTHPDMRRYFMTIPEAVQLITQASSMGTGGEVFILDMGEPVRIMDMAEQLITLSGYLPGKDIEIDIIGTRPGDKMDEELWHEWERPAATRHNKILAAQSNGRTWEQISSQAESLREPAESIDRAQVRKLLQEIIPDYTPIAGNETR
jgi:FlaA1/EpsC-like NDP-sugar epimerase